MVFKMEPNEKDTKKSESSRLCKFSETTVVHVDIPPDPSLALDYVVRNTSDEGTQFDQILSQHEVTPYHCEKVSRGINHVEGGWPKTIRADNEEMTLRYRKKVQKDECFQHTVLENFKERDLPTTSDYFTNDRVDPNKQKRAATSLSWHPVRNQTLAVAYSCMEHQTSSETMSFDSYIWNIENNHKPEMTLKPTSPIVCLEYNLKSDDILIGGCYNGQIGYWDTRSGSKSVSMSPVEQSHKDPVFKVVWLQSNVATDAFSASTDGQVLLWDIRNLNEPIKRLVLDLSKNGNVSNALGAVSMEFEKTMAKFMVGTEQGLVVQLDTTENPIVGTYIGHHGPVYAVRRNPFFPKNFLTVADWTARICYHESLLLDGCWSPVRPAVFFTVRMNGILDVWDILFKPNDPVLSLKVCDEALYSVRVQNNSSLISCGSQLGTVTLLEMSSNLCTLQNSEKSLVSEMFDRETKREKILEALKKQSWPKEKEKEKGDMTELLATIEADFFDAVEALKK
ncbi:hypothetical protein DNTS_034814 [Danionella cerebrum]|uniref:Uncharacterized protein n=1 Tax=Danionella cerebrum TaxID=2873325 RepID=A0A553R9Z0_9TELE|nr:hypothetical protein DNTS_034814 [Danionella translucida]